MRVVVWPAPCAGVLLLIELILEPSAGERGVRGRPPSVAFIRPDEPLVGTVPCGGDGLLAPAPWGGDGLPGGPPAIVVPRALEVLLTAGALGLVVLPAAWPCGTGALPDACPCGAAGLPETGPC